MSAWRVGTEAADEQFRSHRAQQPAYKEFADRLIKYIPGDAIAGYTAAITIFLLNDGTPDPQIWLALGFVAVTVALVVLGWLTTPGRSGLGEMLPDLALAVVAFVVWSLTVPGNGWTEWNAIGDNPEAAAVAGIFAGILIAPVAKALGRP